MIKPFIHFIEYEFFLKFLFYIQMATLRVGFEKYKEV